MAATDTTRPDKTTATATEEAIRVEDLHKSFGALEVLKGVSLTAKKGDVVAIIGGLGYGLMLLGGRRVSGIDVRVSIPLTRAAAGRCGGALLPAR